MAFNQYYYTNQGTTYDNLFSGFSPAIDGFESSRRLYAFGPTIASLAPQESIFLSYLMKLRRRPTNDNKFMFMEERHQWQRRYGRLVVATGATTIVVTCGYDKYGKQLFNSYNPGTLADTNFAQPLFFLKDQIISWKNTAGDIVIAKITADPSTSVTGDVTSGLMDSHEALCVTLTIAILNSKGHATADVVSDTSPGATVQVIGTAYAQGTGSPEGWNDELFAREGYTQIFKTSIKLHSGTSMATEYRGYKDEMKRQWGEKMLEHKMDMEQAAMFSYGGYNLTDKKSYTWGILPYVALYGSNYSLNYGTDGFDQIIDIMQDFNNPEKGKQGTKLMMCSRNILGWFQKLGARSFFNNSIGSGKTFDIANYKGVFGNELSHVHSLFGDWYLTENVLLRNHYQDYAIIVDMANVSWRPLEGNGISRDTFIKTNVQDNDLDGRKDTILTEAGLQIDLPETHAVLKWS
jgi:hypothetical protein